MKLQLHNVELLGSQKGTLDSLPSEGISLIE